MAALQDLITKRHREKLQTDSLEAMRDYLARLCLDVSKLKVVHVAGTKGKGSTCTMVESILRAQGLRTALYTSPHLIDVRERIRIDGKLLPKASFSEHFWRVHSQLRDTANAPDTRFQAMPGYFRFLTLLAFEVFLSQEVDVAIIEVGLGGRLDATNVVTPVVCGITSLDYDHTNVLGDTLAEIAGEKAGILKRHIPSFTVAQRPEALEVLRRRAEEVGSPLHLVPDLSVFSFESPATVQLGLEGEIQRTNCALAVTLANAFLAEADKEKFVTLTDRIYEFECMRNSHDGGPFHVPDAYRGALAASRMLARCQRLRWLPPGRERMDAAAHDEASACHTAPGGETEAAESEVMFYLDGAHTNDSLASGMRWAEHQLRTHACGPQRRLLVFYCSGDRNAAQLLEPLMTLHARLPFWHVAICGNNEPADTQGMGGQGWKECLAATWRGCAAGYPGAPQVPVSIFPSVGALTDWIATHARHGHTGTGEGKMQVYVTGSLLLCGDLTRHLLSVSPPA